MMHIQLDIPYQRLMVEWDGRVQPNYLRRNIQWLPSARPDSLQQFTLGHYVVAGAQLGLLKPSGTTFRQDHWSG